MKNADKFTVIIPTRERANVLGAALNTVTAQNYDNLQIIVSDNFSTDSTRDIVEALHDPRITYLNTGKRLSMSHNWEFALSHVRGGWIAIIGDDDGLLPGAISKAHEIANEYDVSAISSRAAAYTWPNSSTHPYGELTIYRGKGVELHDSRTALRDACSGRIPYSSLPMLYTGGFVDSELIEKARRAGGSFYHSMIPDVYSAIVFTKLTNKYACSNTPLAIGGTSVHSGGTSYMSKKDTAGSGESPGMKFISEPNIPFHPSLLPSKDNAFPPSIELLVYESILQTEHIPPSCQSLTNNAEQLALILGKVKRRHRAEVERWSEQFAERYALDLAAIRRKARNIRSWEKILKFARSISQQNHTLKISGTSQSSINDVYEASLIADRAMNSR